MTLKEAHKLLVEAKVPEDVFGDTLFGSASYFDKRFRDLARAVHPDHYRTPASKKQADDAFKRLGEWREKAEKKIADGTYGDRSALDNEITVRTKTNCYTITRRRASGDIAEIYSGLDKDKTHIVLKVVRSPANNDLMLNEANRLKWLREEGPSRKLKVMQHIPTLLDTFELQQGTTRRRVNVFKFHGDDWFSLADVLTSYGTLDPKDAVWMINRLLAALMAAHQANIVHGAITPDHVMIHPETHNGILIDWCYSVRAGETIKAISPKWREFYPGEVLAKRGATPSTDLYMVASLFSDLIGGNGKQLPPTLPNPLRGLLRACWLGQNSRLNDAYELMQDLGKVFGPRKFRPFRMPAVPA
jgi:serine/threonine protein kinase